MLSIPETHEVLYMHGGAHGQFAAVPLNLCGPEQTGTYITTGFWSNRAADEGAKQIAVRKISGLRNGALLASDEWKVPADSCFVHFCASETIDGVEYLRDDLTTPHGIPLVGDFTSTLLSRRVDISKYGVIYASGGKNLGPSGFVAVIVRKDLLQKAQKRTPAILDWTAHAQTQPIPSIYNTPAVWNIYMHQLSKKILF
jgi:phosphoserine aminotransferase